jgi:hypothetical protein
MRAILRTSMLAAGLFALASTAIAAEAAKEKAEAAKPEPVTLSVALEKPDDPVYVGEPVNLIVTFHNNTGKPLMIEDWDRASFPLVIEVKTTDFPGDESGGNSAPMSGFVGGLRNLMKNDFRELPPGETKITRSITPMIPGNAFVTVQLSCSCDTWVSGRNGKEQKWENGWKDLAFTTLHVAVSNDPSPAMKKHFEDVQRQLDDALIPANQKGQLLIQVGAEKHFFAAEFLRRYAEKQPAGVLRDAAVWQLLGLAKVGTAYQAVPMLMERMIDPSVNQDTRKAILDWAAETYRDGGHMDIADQANYYWPEAIWKQARAAIEKSTADSNPYFAARAKEVLRKLDEKK